MGHSSSSPVDTQFLKSVIAEGQRREAEGQRREAEERAERSLRAAETARAHEAAHTAQAAQWAQHEAALVEKMAALAHELDMARGAVRARALLEACLRHISQARQRLAATAVPTSPSGAASALLDGSTYPALMAYMKASALANGADDAVVLARARKLHGSLSGPMREVTAGGTPAELLAAPARDREALIAFAVLVRFAGRDPGLYAKSGARTQLVLRVPPSGLHATAADLAEAPLLATEISVELLVEHEAGEGGGGGGGGGRQRRAKPLHTPCSGTGRAHGGGDAPGSLSLLRPPAKPFTSFALHFYMCIALFIVTTACSSVAALAKRQWQAPTRPHVVHYAPRAYGARGAAQRQ